MLKSLENLNIAELRAELRERERELNTKGKKEDLRERLESWLIDNGFEVEEYEFTDKQLTNLELTLVSKIDNLGSVLETGIKDLRTNMNSRQNDRESKVNNLKTEMDALRKRQEVNQIKDSVPGETIKEGSLSKAEISYQLEETSRGTENITPAEASTARPIASLVSVETEEMADGSTLGEIKVLLPWSGESGEGLTEELGEADGAEKLAEINSLVVDMYGPIEEPHRRVDNVANKNNNELRESLANINEFTIVSGKPVLCPIASLASVGEKTEVIIKGETGVEPPCVEELVGELDLGDSGKRFELRMAEFNSAVDVVEIRAADSIAAGSDVNSEVPKAGKAKSMLVDRVCEVLNSDRDVDSATLLNPEFRTEPLGGVAEDHPVVASYETVDLPKLSIAYIRIEPHYCWCCCSLCSATLLA